MAGKFADAACCYVKRTDHFQHNDKPYQELCCTGDKRFDIQHKASVPNKVANSVHNYLQHHHKTKKTKKQTKTFSWYKQGHK